MCIVAVGLSADLKSTYKKFINSLERQQYQKYALVFAHLHYDSTVEHDIQEFIQSKDPSFAKKFRAFKKYSSPLTESVLSIKTTLIKDYCEEGELIVDLEATDELIGVHALGLVNSIFQTNPELWMRVGNSLRREQDSSQILPTSPTNSTHMW